MIEPRAVAARSFCSIFEDTEGELVGGRNAYTLPILIEEFKDISVSVCLLRYYSSGVYASVA